MRVLAIVLCFVASANGHLCLLSPPQRGSMQGINKPAASDCILLKSACGGRPVASPQVGVRAGMNFTVTFQKNLDHWLKSSPGYFSISMAPNDSSPFEELSRVKDMGEPSLYLYTRNVSIPDISVMSKAVIQVTYNTLNPDAPPVFYQCSDVYVFNA